MTTALRRGSRRPRQKIGAISVLSSKKDEVLSVAFPLGNLFCRHHRGRPSVVACGPGPLRSGSALAGELPGAIRDSRQLELRARKTTCKSTIPSPTACRFPVNCAAPGIAVAARQTVGRRLFSSAPCLNAVSGRAVRPVFQRKRIYRFFFAFSFGIGYAGFATGRLL